MGITAKALTRIDQQRLAQHATFFQETTHLSPDDQLLSFVDSTDKSHDYSKWIFVTFYTWSSNIEMKHWHAISLILLVCSAVANSSAASIAAEVISWNKNKISRIWWMHLNLIILYSNRTTCTQIPLLMANKLDIACSQGVSD